MKLRKLARQLAAAAVAGAMALSLCMPALAETWDMSNTEKYPNGKGSWISVTRYADIDDHPELNGQFLEIWNSSDKPDPIKEKDEAPVLSGSFETLDLNGYDGTTVYATLQDAHIEYNADSSPTLTTSGNVELTLSGSNTVTHNNTDKLAIDIGDDGWPDYTPGRLTIKGSGSLTAEAPSSGIRIQNGTLDVTDGTVNATAADNGIYALGNTVQVSGGTLCATATGEHSAGIEASHNGQVTVSSGKLTASGGSCGIEASENGRVTVSGGTLNASAKETVAITGSSITVNGGTLKLDDNTAPVGILSEDLNVTNGWLPRDIVEIGAAPEGDAGCAIAAVVLGSAAVWGGYEVVTRVILNELLPEGVAIPANRGQLALLVWNNAGRPEPAAQPAFADVADTDMAKAAQWCVEQGIMEAKIVETFKPEGWMPKFKVIEVWNKAFPKQ